MAEISVLRQALAQSISNITGLRTSAFMPDQPSPPQAIVTPRRVTYDSSMARGLDEYEMIVTVIVGRVEERTAQRTLDGYLSGAGTNSIKQRLEADRTLGGACQTLRVTQMSQYTAIPVGELSYLAAELVVQMYA